MLNDTVIVNSNNFETTMGNSGLVYYKSFLCVFMDTINHVWPDLQSQMDQTRMYRTIAMNMGSKFNRK
jgi:hypothetical protein